MAILLWIMFGALFESMPGVRDGTGEPRESNSSPEGTVPRNIHRSFTRDEPERVSEVRRENEWESSEERMEMMCLKLSSANVSSWNPSDIGNIVFQHYPLRNKIEERTFVTF